jgi:hypothetical protein
MELSILTFKPIIFYTASMFCRGVIIARMTLKRTWHIDAVAGRGFY